MSGIMKVVMSGFETGKIVNLASDPERLKEEICVIYIDELADKVLNLVDEEVVKNNYNVESGCHNIKLNKNKSWKKTKFYE